MTKIKQTKILFILVILLLSVLCRETKSQNNSPRPLPPRKSFAEIVNMPVVYAVPGMHKVKVKKDINYKSEANSELKMDVYTPPNLRKKNKRPAVFFIHGGTALENHPKDWGIFASWGKLVAASDMVGVVFTHRMGFPKPEFALAEKDLSDAINYVRDNSDSLGVDKDRIALVTFSAGGPLLSLPMRETPNYVRALIAFYSFLDVQHSEMHRQSVNSPEVLKKYSPISYIAPNATRLPPIFIARAGLDEIPGLNNATDRFVSESLAKNVNLEVMNHPAGVHGFDNQTDDARSREIIHRVLDFLRINLDQTLKNKINPNNEKAKIQLKRLAERK